MNRVTRPEKTILGPAHAHIDLPQMAYFRYERPNPFCRMAAPQENAEVVIRTPFRLYGF